VQMIETGDYIVPKVGSEPYLRKPPLINWLVAASFKISGNATNGRRACLRCFVCSQSRSCLSPLRA